MVLILGRSFFEGFSGPADVGPTTAKEFVLTGVVCLSLAVVELLCGIGLINLQPWPRVAVIVFHVAWAVLLALSLVGLRLHPSLFSMLFRLTGLGFQVWILAYLFSTQVKVAFSKPTAQNA